MFVECYPYMTDDDFTSNSYRPSNPAATELMLSVRTLNTPPMMLILEVVHDLQRTREQSRGTVQFRMGQRDCRVQTDSLLSCPELHRPTHRSGFTRTTARVGILWLGAPTCAIYLARSYIGSR